ncbi:MAG: cytochrome c-type biogenesis protein CcmH [Halomonadaceae bacterium]|nr:MAG: cytochrome c-type biogenesis protein CcmH [Halomonadaceae bacterium]
MWRLLLLTLCLLLALPVQASIQTNELSDPEKQRRYQDLTRELRCPLCQNENIAESAAPIANDMRRDVHRRLEAGQSDEEIVEALVERFGEFVRYRPVMSSSTVLLWYGPFIAIAIGLLVVLILGLGARRRQQAADKALGDGAEPVQDSAVLNPSEQARLRRLLHDNEHNQ